MITIPVAALIFICVIAMIEALVIVWLGCSLMDWKVKSEARLSRIKFLDEQSNRNFKINEDIRESRDHFRQEYDAQKAAICKLQDHNEFLTGEVKRLTELSDDNTETIARLSVEKSKALDDVLAAEEASKILTETLQTITTERDQATASTTNLWETNQHLRRQIEEQRASILRLQEQVNDHWNKVLDRDATIDRLNDEIERLKTGESILIKLADERGEEVNKLMMTIERLNKLVESHANTSCGPSNAQIQHSLDRARGQFKDGIDQLVMRQALGTLRDGLDSAMKQLQNSLLSGVDRIGGELRTSLLNPEGEEVTDVQRFGDEEWEESDDDSELEDDDVEDGSDTDWDDDEE